MTDLTNLQFALTLCIYVALTMFFIMNGSDFGMGAATFLVRKTAWRSEIVRASTHVWFGNEAWIIIGLASIFGAFPQWYASLTSGYYLLFLLVLLGLILRGGAFSYRLLWKNKAYNKFWDWAFFLGGILPPFLLAVIFSSTLQGIPISPDGFIRAGFADIFTPFTVCTGVAVLLLCMKIGVTRSMKFVGKELNMVLRKRLTVINAFAIVAVLVTVILLSVYTTAFAQHAVSIVLLAILCVACMVASMVLTAKRADYANYWVAAIAMGAFVLLLFSSLYPNAIIASSGDTLTLSAAASGRESQLWVAFGMGMMIPLIVLGQIAAYYYLNKYYKVPDTDISY